MDTGKSDISSSVDKVASKVEVTKGSSTDDSIKDTPTAKQDSKAPEPSSTDEANLGDNQPSSVEVRAASTSLAIEEVRAAPDSVEEEEIIGSSQDLTQEDTR